MHTCMYMLYQFHIYTCVCICCRYFARMYVCIYIYAVVISHIYIVRAHVVFMIYAEVISHVYVVVISHICTRVCICCINFIYALV